MVPYFLVFPSLLFSHRVVKSGGIKAGTQQRIQGFHPLQIPQLPPCPRDMSQGVDSERFSSAWGPPLDPLAGPPGFP